MKTYRGLAGLAAVLLGLPVIAHAQGFVTPDDIQNRIDLQTQASDKNSSLVIGFGAKPAAPLFPCSPEAISFDLRQLGLVADPGDQGQTCNSCWAFSTGSAIETSYAYFNGTQIDTSKQ